MKKLVCSLFILVATTALYAQDQTKPASSQATTSQQPAKSTHPQPTVTHHVAVKNYCCPAGDYCSPKPGACPNDKKTLIREGMYYCADGTSSKEPGKCADGTDMVKMVDKNKKADDAKKAAPNTPAK